MRAALLNKKGVVIGDVFQAPKHGCYIEVAKAFTECGEPLGVKFYKISRSKANMAKAELQQPLCLFGDVYKFYSLDYLKVR